MWKDNPKLLLLILCNNLSILSTWLLGPIYASYVETLGSSAFSAGSSWGLMAVVSAAVMLSTGRLIDRKGLERHAMIAGYTALGLGSLGFIMATEIGHVFVAQGVNGVGLGLVKPSWKELYARYEDAGQEVQEWGWADGSAQLLTGVASFFGGLIVEAFSFTALFVTMGVLQVCAALAGFGLKRDA